MPVSIQPPLAFFTIESFDNNFSHKLWVKNIKNKNLPPISKPASQVTPIFCPVFYPEEYPLTHTPTPIPTNTTHSTETNVYKC